MSLLALPPELVDAILSNLSAQDLAFVSATCRALRKHAISDFHWHRLVQRNVPGQAVTRPGPCSSYRELYVAHDRVWFLPKYKIWFCDRDLMGMLIITRFDQRRGCIEGYQLLAVSSRSTFQHWSADSQVIIHGFEPQVKLHLDKPVVQFRVRDRQEDGGFSSRPGANRFADEMPMTLEERMGAMFSNFLLTRPLDPETAEEKLEADYPYDNIWPPPTIPARHHVSGARSGQGVVNLSPDDRPRSKWQVSDQTFRIRQWMEMAGTPVPPRLLGQAVRGPPDLGLTGVHIGEEIITYSTLDPVLYTPTPTKPWRGIWVGDYSGHGCEFLLINQPDDPPATDAELGLVRDEDEADEAWEKRRAEARMYRGRLEAIKLTGDPNVPRGEYTFVADDLGPKGFVGVAADEPFVGARVVHSQGHIAGTGFVRGESRRRHRSAGDESLIVLAHMQTSTLRASFCSSPQTGWRSTGSGLGTSASSRGSTLTTFWCREGWPERQRGWHRKIEGDDGSARASWPLVCETSSASASPLTPLSPSCALFLSWL